YKTIKSLCPEGCLVKCLEYDTRFSIYGDDFQFFDYKDPLNLPLEWKHSFDVVIVDPPFLSEECLCRMAVTAKFLTKDKIILCTGMVMEAMAEKLLGAKLCTFIPRHTNQLQNEFRCYTNYDAIHLNDT
ncbi:EFMT1-like protein, partial [Mya arenaria]